MNDDDLRRELVKIQDVLLDVQLHLKYKSEMDAALHRNSKVLYSPLYSGVVEAARAFERVADEVTERMKS